jgi:hypothetical protein
MSFKRRLEPCQGSHDGYNRRPRVRRSAATLGCVLERLRRIDGFLRNWNAFGVLMRALRVCVADHSSGTASGSSIPYVALVPLNVVLAQQSPKLVLE